MKYYLLVVLAINLSGCAFFQKGKVAQTTEAERSIASEPIMALKLNSDISGFNNESAAEKTTVVYGKKEVPHTYGKYACYISMKTPSKTYGVLRKNRLFYAKMGNCHVFDRFSSAPNFCTENVLHLYNSQEEARSQAEPVGIISSWVPGNPTRYYAASLYDYAAVINGCFDINSNLPSAGADSIKGKDL